MRLALAQGAVASGDLAMPLPKLRLPVGYRHMLSVDPARARRPQIEAFRARLRQQSPRAPPLTD